MKINRKTKTLSPKTAGRSLRTNAIGTLEIVIIIAVLLGVALLFRTQIQDFSDALFEKAFATDYVNDLKPGAGK